MIDGVAPIPTELPVNAAKFIFEQAQLRLTPRSGMHHIHEKTESVSDHVQRASVIGFLLAHMENFANPALVVTMIVFHDMHESRTGDDDLVQKRYIKIDALQAAKDQTLPLGDAGKDILKMWEDFAGQRNQAAIIAKDADWLEMAFTAKEVVNKGNSDAQPWIEAARQGIKTASAVKLLLAMETTDPSSWWKDMFGSRFDKK